MRLRSSIFTLRRATIRMSVMTGKPRLVPSTIDAMLRRVIWPIITGTPVARVPRMLGVAFSASHAWARRPSSSMTATLPSRSPNVTSMRSERLSMSI